MTDCLVAREILEIATVEPGGLDRLAAGDTPEAALAASHLAGCGSCTDELARLQRADAVIRQVFGSMLSADLRGRVLANVRAAGVERAAIAHAAPAPIAPALVASAAVGPAVATGTSTTSLAPPGPVAPLAAPTPLREPAPGLESGPPNPPPWPLPTAAPIRLPTVVRPALASRRRVTWPAAVAAVLVIGVLGGLGLGRLSLGGTGSGSPGVDEGAAALAAVSRETASLMAAPDARSVVLRDATGRPAGSLVTAPSLGRIVVLATDLPAPGANQEYRCWVETNGSRTSLGEMWLMRDVAWWSGPATLPAGPASAMRFGISLASTAAASSSITGPAPSAVLVGP